MQYGKEFIERISFLLCRSVRDMLQLLGKLSFQRDRLISKREIEMHTLGKNIKLSKLCQNSPWIIDVNISPLIYICSFKLFKYFVTQNEDTLFKFEV